MKASLVYNQTLYTAQANELPATLNLIEGIYSQFQLQAFRLLRKRIFTDDLPSESVYGAIKVSAKSVSFENISMHEKIQKIIEIKPNQAPSFDRDLLAKTLNSPTQIDDFLNQLILNRAQSELRYLSDRPISAVLISKEHKILSFARSYSSINRIFHAEYVLMKRLFEQGFREIPEGAILYTTLKPCKMCAGLIWDYSQNQNPIEVHYREFDHGPHGRSTVLDAHSYERRRACGLTY